MPDAGVGGNYKFSSIVRCRIARKVMTSGKTNWETVRIARRVALKAIASFAHLSDIELRKDYSVGWDETEALWRG